MKYEVPVMFDAHVHFRQGKEALDEYVGQTSRCCDHAVVMPNVDPPITTPEQARQYRSAIEAAHRESTVGDHPFTPLMVGYLTTETTVENVTAMAAAGVTAYKLYPLGGTTNSHSGIPSEWLRELPDQLLDVFGEMEKHNMVLCLHGELPDEWLLVREPMFVGLQFIRRVCETFPMLRVVLEHISTRAGLQAVRAHRDFGRKVAGSLTLHHMVVDIGDVVGQPLNFCRPCPAMPVDKLAIREAALNAEEGFFLGSDSAPHAAKNKFCMQCSAGCYTSPILVEALFQLFYGSRDSNLNWQGNFAAFTSYRGREFYGLPAPSRTLQLVEHEHKVPLRVRGYSDSDYAMIFGAGTPLGFQLFR